jgi:hypothetical protein
MKLMDHRLNISMDLRSNLLGYKNEEIEKKYIVTKGNMNSIFSQLLVIFKNPISISQNVSSDFYWHLPDNLKGNGDFIRVREFPRFKGELTVKKAKVNNVHRIEIDVPVDSRQAKHFANQLFGLPAGVIRKHYKVLILDKYDTMVSIYKVTGDKRIFLEIEARTLKKVDTVEKIVLKSLDMTYEPKSLYQLFLEK